MGYLAAAAVGLKLDRGLVAEWFASNRLGVRERGLRDALTLRRVRQGDPLPTEQDPEEHSWIRESHDFDATKLDLDLAVVTFPGHDRPEQLMGILRGTERVVRIYEGYDRDVIAIVLYDGAAERRRLQTLLEEHEPRLRWVVVRDLDDSFAASTWLSLARRVAVNEHLLTK